MKNLVFAAFLFSCTGALAQTAGGSRVTIADTPASIVLYREISGSYDPHARVFEELLSYAGKNIADGR